MNLASNFPHQQDIDFKRWQYLIGCSARFWWPTLARSYDTSTSPFRGRCRCGARAAGLRRCIARGEPHIPHHRQADNLRAHLEVPERSTFCHRGRVGRLHSRLNPGFPDRAPACADGSVARGPEKPWLPLGSLCSPQARNASSGASPLKSLQKPKRACRGHCDRHPTETNSN